MPGGGPRGPDLAAAPDSRKCPAAPGGIPHLPPGWPTLVPLGVALLIIGLMMEAGAIGAVKTIKVSAKLLAGRSPQAPGGRAPFGLDGTAGHSSATGSRSG
jgi:hypothetical protein